MGQVISTLKKPRKEKYKFHGRKNAVNSKKYKEAEKRRSVKLQEDATANESLKPAQDPLRIDVNPRKPSAGCLEAEDDESALASRAKSEEPSEFLRNLAERIHANFANKEAFQAERDSYKHEIETYKVTIFQMNQELDSLKKVNQELNEKMTALIFENKKLRSVSEEEQNRQLLDEINKKFQALEDIKHELDSQVRTDIARHANTELRKKEYYEKEVERMVTNQKALKAKIETLQESVKERDLDAKYFKYQRDKLESEKATLNKALYKLEDEVWAKKELIDSQKEKINALTDTCSKFKRATLPRHSKEEKEVKALKDKIEELTDIVQKGKEEKQQLIQKLEKFRLSSERKSDLTFKINRWKFARSQAGLKNYKGELRLKYNKVNTKLESVKKKCEELKKSSNRMNALLASKERQVSQLTRKLYCANKKVEKKEKHKEERRALKEALNKKHTAYLLAKDNYERSKIDMNRWVRSYKKLEDVVREKQEKINKQAEEIKRLRREVPTSEVGTSH